MTRARLAYSKYKEYLEEQQKIKETVKKQRMQKQQQKEAEEQKKIADKKGIKQRRKNAKMLKKEEDGITTAEKEQRTILSSLGALLQEAEAKLSEAIKAGDLDKIAVAHGLLEIGRKRLTPATTDLSSLAEKRKACVAKMKRHLDQSDTVDSGCSSSAAKKANHQKDTSQQF